MKIVINAILYHEKPRGVGVYLNNLIKNISQFDKKNEYFIYYGKWMKDYEFIQTTSPNINLIEISIPRNKLIRNLYQAFIFPIYILRHKPDLLHIPDTSPIIIKTTKTISTIHDLAEFYCPEKYSKVQAIGRKMIVKLQVALSDKIITISDFSRKTLIEKLNINKNKIITIYNGVDVEKFTKDVRREEIEKFEIEDKKYVLYVGEIERTKNVSILIEAHKELYKKGFKLVLCGKKGNDYGNILKIIDKHNLKNKIIFTNYVTENELIALYRNAWAFVFPSLFEGFGLPIIEGMASGVPVICSNKSCLPEIGGNAVLTFEPHDRNSLLDCYNQLYYNEDLVFKLNNLAKERVKEFTWEKMAKKVIEAYEDKR